MPQKKTWQTTDPPQQLHWFKIILGKLDTIQNHPTDRDATLLPEGEFRRRIPRRRLPHWRQILKDGFPADKKFAPEDDFLPEAKFPPPGVLHFQSWQFKRPHLNGLRRQGPFLWIQRCKNFKPTLTNPKPLVKKNDQRWIRCWLWIKPKQHLHQL